MNTIVLKGNQGDGQYENLQFLTPGGMGDIYTAWDTFNSCKVAIKIIRIQHLADKQLLQEEFKIATNLTHSNIIKTFYYDEFSDNTGEYFYSVMEFSDKGSLRKLLENSSRLIPLETCLSYFYDLLKGLQEAHKYIIHRDLKPENILIGTDGSLKICDFGIAKYVDMLTRTKTYKGYGTSPYISPECWLFDVNTNQMDIYSLGIVFFEILTSQLPFKGPTDKDFKDQHLFSNLPMMSAIRSDIPVVLSDIIRKMTNKSVNDRYKNATEILDALDRWREATKNTTLDIQNVLQSAHNKLNITTANELKAQKEKEEYEERQQILNFSIDQLFNQFSQVADTINTSLQSEKIQYKKFPFSNPFANTFRLHFFNGTLTVSFYNADINQYIKERREQHKDFQIRNYGFVMQEIHPDYIEIDNVTLIGKATLNFNHKEKYAGFNLVLLKANQEDIYGNWWVCKFIDTQIFANVPNDYYYAIDTPDFYKEYNYGRGRIMHVRHMGFSLLQSEDIVNLISLMPSI